MHFRFRVLALTLAAVAAAGPLALAQTDGTTIDQTPVTTPTTEEEGKVTCEALHGRGRALCALAENLKKKNLAVPTCAIGEKNYGLAHAYCTLKSKTQEEESQFMAREKKLERRILQKGKGVDRMQWRTRREEMEGRMKEELKGMREQGKSMRREFRGKLKMLKPETESMEGGAATLEAESGGEEEVELRAWLRSRRAHTQPTRGERKGVRRHLGRKVRSPRSVHEEGEKMLKNLAKERSERAQ